MVPLHLLHPVLHPPPFPLFLNVSGAVSVGHRNKKNASFTANQMALSQMIVQSAMAVQTKFLRLPAQVADFIC